MQTESTGETIYAIHSAAHRANFALAQLIHVIERNHTYREVADAARLFIAADDNLNSKK